LLVSKLRTISAWRLFPLFELAYLQYFGLQRNLLFKLFFRLSPSLQRSLRSRSAPISTRCRCCSRMINTWSKHSRHTPEFARCAS